jgi:hypothetical protein
MSLSRVFALLFAAAFAAHAHDPGVLNMVQTAKAFLASLDDQQLAKATFKFADDERENWHFIPRERKGLPLREMTPTQKHLASALLSSGLSTQGYIKATEIMSLEDVLKALEQGKGPQRDPEGYFFSIFGDPSETGVWGVRIEGHHLAQNFTVVKGVVAGSPEFFGANPAEVRVGPRKGLRVLAHEEDYARALVQSLNPDQRKSAIVADEAYKDILTMASRKAAIEGKPSGIQSSKLDSKQRELLNTLLDEYVNNVAAPIAAHRKEQVGKAKGEIWFAWAGGIDRGQPHYYRLQSSTFLIEYDDTQNGANHIHSVWRDFDGDFGRDLLKDHYAQLPHNR